MNLTLNEKELDFVISAIAYWETVGEDYFSNGEKCAGLTRKQFDEVFRSVFNKLHGK